MKLLFSKNHLWIQLLGKYKIKHWHLPPPHLSDAGVGFDPFFPTVHGQTGYPDSRISSSPCVYPASAFPSLCAFIQLQSPRAHLESFHIVSLTPPLSLRILFSIQQPGGASKVELIHLGHLAYHSPKGQIQSHYADAMTPCIPALVSCVCHLPPPFTLPSPSSLSVGASHLWPGFVFGGSPT